jgi:hypothetical protein
MTYGLKVRSPVNMQTEWREDYSHREAKYLERIDLRLASSLARCDSLIKMDPNRGT